jgi:hypothetical protein
MFSRNRNPNEMSVVPRFTEDPAILLKTPLQVIPRGSTSSAEQVNAAVRLTLYLGVLFAGKSRSFKPLYYALAAVVVCEVSGIYESIFPPTDVPTAAEKSRLAQSLAEQEAAAAALASMGQPVPTNQDELKLTAATGESAGRSEIEPSNTTRIFATRPAAQLNDVEDALTRDLIKTTGIARASSRPMLG